MSVRAYKVIKPAETARQCTFNLWHNQELVQDIIWRNIDCWYATNSGDEICELELEVRQIKKIIANPKYKLDKSTKEQFEADIAGLKNDDLVNYECH